MDRDEWIAQYSKRIQDVAGWSESEAGEAAKVGAIEYERNERAAGNAVIWERPQEYADDEMSYWENDGE